MGPSAGSDLIVRVVVATAISLAFLVFLLPLPGIFLLPLLVFLLLLLALVLLVLICLLLRLFPHPLLVFQLPPLSLVTIPRLLQMSGMSVGDKPSSSANPGRGQLRTVAAIITLTRALSTVTESGGIPKRALS